MPDPKPVPPEIRWEVREGFKQSYRKYLREHPRIREAMSEFNKCKRANPPQRLPGKMNDHKLGGPLKGFMDCHLNGDVILIYKPIANGAIRLLLGSGLTI
jgi:mRNA-degrading endonuclease YafQ of YafQ-DinJ toxin-antitoxin module